MKNNIIIHISDLHITDSSGRFGQVYENTYLRAGDNKNDLLYSFTDSIITKIKEYSCDKRFLIITGDITNIAEEAEFDTAIIVLSKIIKDLNIQKENILLIPGDHDIHRDSIKNALRNHQSKDINGYEFNEEKFKNFQKLYSTIKGTNFEYSKLIFDTIIADRILICGVNSNYHVGQNPANGYLPLEKFDSELSSLVATNEEMNLILALHHNISGTHEDRISGQWELENRKDLIPIFLKHKVKCIFHGNEHTPKSLKLPSSEIYVSDSGAISGKDPNGSFKIYDIESKPNSIILKNVVFELRKINAVDESNFGNWVTIPIKETSTEIAKFVILENQPEDLSKTIEIPPLDTENKKEGIEEAKKDGNNKNAERLFYSNVENQDKLYEIIKEKKLFHSGHFHWSESSRAHNWIDVSKLLESKDDLYFVKNLIIDVIKTFNLFSDCDLIIGLGYEGNIISSKASIKFNIPYTSLPYSYRYEDHHEYEKKLNYQNTDGNYKNVLLITDVVNDGRTIRNLIAEKEKEFFHRVEKVTVISLFYTGHQEIDIDILNYNKLPKEYDRKKDHKVNNIDFYTIKSLRVEKCPYKSDFRNKCFIYRDDLSDVHRFYDERDKKTTAPRTH